MKAQGTTGATWQPRAARETGVISSSRWPVVLVASLILACGPRAVPADEPATTGVDYARDIQPRLARSCYQCHGPDKQEGGLRLDAKLPALMGGNRGLVIQPGAADGGTLLGFLTGENADGLRMPPGGPFLTADEVTMFRRWIDEGAEWPEDGTAPTVKMPGTGHWAFQPVVEPRLPECDDPWVRNPIDAFVLERISTRGLRPAMEADRATLIRRLSLDLVGLPPTPQEVDQFVLDPSSGAYERLVESLLASAHFGERWGRHWLDVAHYADSGGFESDVPRTIWRYRDWVIQALNDDLPFDQFVIKQLAGDLLPQATATDRIATGFLLNSPQDGGSEPSRVDALVDRVNTVATAFLGLTLACAQCHAHKFDPFTQRDYYALFAFLNDADEIVLELGEPEQVQRRDALRAQISALEAERDKYLEGLGPRVPAWEQMLTDDERASLTEDVRSILKAVPAQRTPNQHKRLLAALAALRDAGCRERQATLATLVARLPDLPTTPALQAAAAPRDTRILIRGELANPGASVAPGVPSSLPALATQGRATRLDLANWLVSPSQPLTPRVTVNRIWQQLFGLGLVETQDDFGTRGELPSHPELLDWLASQFMADGWHIKSLLRGIVSSATYRQASTRRADQDAMDPRNRLLARQNRLRVEAEIIRDAALCASGLLSRRVGGPGVFPFQPSGVLVNRATPAEWVESLGADRYRRGMYTWMFRLTPHPHVPLFDAPDSLSACTRRRPTNTPLQALTLLNDPSFVECARALARRLRDETDGSDAAMFERAFRLSLGRRPSNEELAVLQALLSASRGTPREASAAETTLRSPDVSAATSELAAWTEVCRALLNLDEFLTRE